MRSQERFGAHEQTIFRSKIGLAKRDSCCYDLYYIDAYEMVDVAQLVEHWVVAPVAEGSSPFIHPKRMSRG